MKIAAAVARFRERHPRTVRAGFLLVTFGFSFFIGLLTGAWTLACRVGCPSTDVLEQYQPHQTSKLYAADGRFIAELGLERRTLIGLDSIPKSIIDAFVITEDKRFYGHSGIDWIRVAGATLHNVKASIASASLRYDQGFSTITMQLARNVFPDDLSREKTLTRKIREAKVARAIEAKYSKEKILELYLNQIPLGNGAFGVETASQRYFGKSVRQVTLAEAAMLAALPKAPNTYNPRRNADVAMTRRNFVLGLMKEAGVISEAEWSLARAYPLQLATRTESGDVAPYFVEWVRRQLDDHFGKQLYEQGLKVYTTLDLEMQSAAERALENQLKWVESGAGGVFRHDTYERFLARSASGAASGGANSPYLQGAFIAIDPQSGAVRALVGGRNYDDSKFNRATQALRPAGSTFKPFVYADAIRNGRPASYLVNDDTVRVMQMSGELWEPQNFDLKYLGPMTLREGLYQSRNVIAIRLGMELGEPSVIETARRFGITTPMNPYPSLHIGAADVYPIEMVSAYGAFATLGYLAPTTGIIRVETADGRALWQPMLERRWVLTAEEAWLMVDMMKDVIRNPKGTAYGSVRIRGGFPYAAGGKTGTTDDGQNVWFIGYTSDLVAGVWMGFDNPRKIVADAQGGRLAAPAWAAFMNEVYTRRPTPTDWPRPDGIIYRRVDRTTGMLANIFCPGDAVGDEYYLPGTEPILQCSVHTPATAAARRDSAQGGRATSTPPPRR